MRRTAATSVRISRVVPADPETTFAAWTDPDRLRQWSCPEGSVITLVEVDLRVGGRYRLRIEGEAGVHTATGAYQEIVRPTNLVYTWDWEEAEHAMGETLVSVEFRAHPHGTEVVLTHERFPTQEAAAGHLDGWTSCLNRLERLLA